MIWYLFTIGHEAPLGIFAMLREGNKEYILDFHKILNTAGYLPTEVITGVW